MSREFPTTDQGLHGPWDGDNGLGLGESAAGGMGDMHSHSGPDRCH